MRTIKDCIEGLKAWLKDYQGEIDGSPQANVTLAELEAWEKGEGRTANVYHPLNTDSEINTRVSYCGGCAQTVNNQRFCHKCGRKLLWENIGQNSRDLYKKYMEQEDIPAKNARVISKEFWNLFGEENQEEEE